MQPPPPTPARTLAKIKTNFEGANPHTRFPIVNITVATQKLVRRPKISLSFPLSGWVAVRPMRYPEPSHEMIDRELNSWAIVEERVEVMVVSAAARKVATHVEIIPATTFDLMVVSCWARRGVLSDIVALQLSSVKVDRNHEGTSRPLLELGGLREMECRRAGVIDIRDEP